MLFLIILFLIQNFILTAQKSIEEEYSLLLEDLRNITTFGYKSFYKIEQEHINYDLGSSSTIQINNENNFAIIGEGFFKIYDESNKEIMFTRSGDFIRKGEDLYIKKGEHKLLSPISTKELITRYTHLSKKQEKEISFYS